MTTPNMSGATGDPSSTNYVPRCSICQNAIVACVCTREVLAAHRNPELPQPETTDETISRKFLMFALVQLVDILSHIQHTAADVLFFGVHDDDEGPATYWQKLEGAFERLEALRRVMSVHGFPVTNYEETILVEMERIRTCYQRSSGRGVMRLPLVKVNE